MTKLNWQDVTTQVTGPQWEAPYKSLTIRAQQDLAPYNPLEDSDCEPPTLVASHGLESYGDGAGDALESLSDGLLKRHSAAIAERTGYGRDAFHQEALELQRDGGGDLIDYKRDLLRNALEEMESSARHYGAGSGAVRDYFDTLQELWRLQGVESAIWRSTGCSQGDVGIGLSVATPAWAKHVGAPRPTHKRQCEYAGKLWGAWAWGDVYLWEVIAPDGESLDAMGCYFGSDFAESGLENAALEVADSILARGRRNRQHTLAAMIRNNVPLAKRPALLEQGGKLESLYG